RDSSGFGREKSGFGFARRGGARRAFASQFPATELGAADRGSGRPAAARRARRGRRHVRPDRDLRADARGRAPPALHRPRSPWTRRALGHVRAHWQALHKIPRLDWAEYLLWVRDTVGLPIENGIELTSLEVTPGAVCARLKGGQELYARKAVLALGREGSGALRWPKFASFDPARRGADVLHSADDIDFRALKGRRIGVLGAGASAFDNAAEALEAGAAEVVMFARRPVLP